MSTAETSRPPKFKGKDKEKEKDKGKTEKEKDRPTAVGKENASAYKKAAQAAPARSGHARSASQPKLHIAADSESPLA